MNRPREQGRLRNARRTFAHLLTSDDQFSLAREIAETRGEELCRAYKNLVAVSYGYRLRHKKNMDKVRVMRRPCVIFIVDGKWSGDDEDPEQTLPPFLYSYYSVQGKRELCGVPTDVDDVATYDAIEPQVKLEGIDVDAGGDREPGSIACAIQRSSRPEQTFVISCYHVFSHFDSKKATLRPRGEQVTLAGTLQIVGSVQDQPPFSFDAQLAKVTNVDVLRRILNSVRFTDVVEARGDFPSLYWILTPGGPVKVEWIQFMAPSLPLDYHRPGMNQVVHEELVVSQFATSEKTERGDSGSPLATKKSGGTFLGMHIAGGPEKAYGIPAWRLLSAKNYKRAGDNEIWSLLNGDEMEVAEPLIEAPPGADLLRGIMENHRFRNSVAWRLAPDGIRIEDGPPEHTGGEPETVGRVWRDFEQSIGRWANHYDVPVELIVATICTESSGRPSAVREEPGYISDRATPNKVSVGLMQTLISTASETLGDRSIDRTWLLNPDNSINAGTAYINKQRRETMLDPPKVACAYNAGSLRRNDAPENRWKMRQFPRDTSEHADRFVAWFNDCFRLWKQLDAAPVKSFYRMLN